VILNLPLLCTQEIHTSGHVVHIQACKIIISIYVGYKKSYYTTGYDTASLT